MSLYEFTVPFFFGGPPNNQPPKKKKSEWEKEYGLGLLKGYLETPCLLLSDDDGSSCCTHEEKYEMSQSSTTRGKPQPEDPRRVRFNSACIREHSVTVGDHPMCRILPLTLDWNYSKEKIYDINEYESMRTVNGSRNARGNLPRLDYWKRRKILEEAGLANIPKQTVNSMEDWNLEKPKNGKIYCQELENEAPSSFFEIEVLYPEVMDMKSFGVTVEVIED